MKAIFSGLRFAAVGAIAGAVLLMAAPAGAAEVVAYSAGNAKMHKLLIAAFEKKHPNIKVKLVSGSTGPMARRAIAEKSNPQADVIFTINTFTLAKIKAAGAFQPYSPKNSPVPEDMRDPDGFWTAHYAGVYGMAVNTKLLKEKNLPMPQNWVDLLKPVYKGHITIASPTKSGTGLIIFSTLVDVFGWNFLDNLHQNIFQYTSSGSAPARKAAAGEVVIGLSFDSAIKRVVDSGQPIKMVLPSVLPWAVRGGGLLAGAPHEKEGKLLLDFLFSEDAAKIFNDFGGLTAVPGYGWLGQKGIDVKALNLWKMRRPLDIAEFKRVWAAKYEK